MKQLTLLIIYCRPAIDNKEAEEEEVILQCLSKDKGHDHSDVISAEFKNKLHEFYEPYNEKLFRIIGRRYNWTK